MKRILISISALGVIFLSGLSSAAQTTDCDPANLKGLLGGQSIIPQNWTCADRQQYWFTDQGSQIIPYDWFLNLEQMGNTSRFSAQANMNRYGYLPQNPSDMNKDGLPIGFTLGRTKGNSKYRNISKRWLGMTCAACHTGQVEFKGAKFLIEGAPTMGDFESLIVDLVGAMQATLDDGNKFDRFAKALKQQNKPQLRDQLADITKIRDAWNQRNRGSKESGKYGHGRLDALGAIFNETAAMALGVPGNTKSANAPVSYPFVWDTPQHDRVQWNGSIKNAKLGSLSRNVGEVLGVFGALKLNNKRLLKTGHTTSVDVGALAKLENLLWKLQSPQWSDTTFPAPPKPEDDIFKTGRASFEKHCIACHNDIKRTDPDRRIKARMFPLFNPKNKDDPDALRTDPTMAVNFLTRKAEARALTGRPVRYLKILSDGEEFSPGEKDETRQIKILAYSVAGTIVRELLVNPREVIAALKAGQPEDQKKSIEDVLGKVKTLRVHQVRKLLEKIGDKYTNYENKTDEPKCFPEGSLPCYKARPLNGIWATAPYLHNGSVRTMRQLLLPASKRQKTFKVGSTEFDPNDIGFVDEGAFTLDTSRPGNSNAGHDGPVYGNAELEADKDQMNALLEYLKTL